MASKLSIRKIDFKNAGAYRADGIRMIRPRAVEVIMLKLKQATDKDVLSILEKFDPTATLRNTQWALYRLEARDRVAKVEATDEGVVWAVQQ
jgi:hypothetical protein